MNTLNLVLFQWITAGSHPTPWVLFIASGFALWGSWAFAALLAVALWRHRTDRAYLVAVAAMAGATALISHAIGAALHAPRPFVQGLAPAYIQHAASGSMPSTHASVMFMVALACLLRPGLRALSVPLLLLAAGTGWARIYVGVHFPVDIVAGLLLGGVIAGATALALWFAHLVMSRTGRATRDSEAASSLWRPS
jgi:undecaprenyl-diphosphatase